MKTIKTIFDEHIFLNKNELSSLSWDTLFLTDMPIVELVIYRDYGNCVQFIYLYSGVSLKISQEYMKIFYNFQSSRYEEIIDLEPKNNLEKFIKGMSIVSRALSRKICNDNPLDFLDQIRELCSIGTEEFSNTYSDFLGLEFKPWILRSLSGDKEI